MNGVDPGVPAMRAVRRQEEMCVDRRFDQTSALGRRKIGQCGGQRHIELGRACDASEKVPHSFVEAAKHGFLHGIEMKRLGRQLELQAAAGEEYEMQRGRCSVDERLQHVLRMGGVMGVVDDQYVWGAACGQGSQQGAEQVVRRCLLRSESFAVVLHDGNLNAVRVFYSITPVSRRMRSASARVWTPSLR